MAESKRTPHARATVLEALRLGHFRRTAARLAGIGSSTLSEWIASDEEFRAEVEVAEAEDEAALVIGVKSAGGKDWRASAWILERRHRDHWGSKGGAGDDGAGKTTGARTVPFGFEEVEGEGL